MTRGKCVTETRKILMMVVKSVGNVCVGGGRESNTLCPICMVDVYDANCVVTENWVHVQ